MVSASRDCYNNLLIHCISFRCCCGRLTRQHHEDAVVDPLSVGRSSWDQKLDTMEYPSDANGHVVFKEEGSSLKPAKVILTTVKPV